MLILIFIRLMYFFMHYIRVHRILMYADEQTKIDERIYFIFFITKNYIRNMDELLLLLFFS